MKRSGLIMLILFFITVMLIVVFQYASGKGNPANQQIKASGNYRQEIPENIRSVPLPVGYKRVPVDSACFGDFLRNIRLRQNNTVYLYNGQAKQRQDLHYAVLDISTSNKDLQQCADAIMRLRAEYFFAAKQYRKIEFPGNNGSPFSFEKYARSHNQCRTHDCLVKFMETVYMYCGTYTLGAMSRSIATKEMKPGDIFVKAGAPGHAMIVVDMAANEKTGKKIYLLAQGYMPAQDMHIVINPNNSALSPWYELNDDEQVITPGWVFDKKQLRRF